MKSLVLSRPRDENFISTGLSAVHEDWIRQCSAMNKKLIERASLLVDPTDGKKLAFCSRMNDIIKQEQVAFYAPSSKYAFHWIATPNKAEKRSLSSLATALKSAQKALETLPIQWQEALFLESNDEAAVEAKNRGTSWPEAANRVRATSETLSRVARRAKEYTSEAYASSFSEGTRGRPLSKGRMAPIHTLVFAGMTGTQHAPIIPTGNSRKRYAAEMAYDLIVRFGKRRPNLSHDGLFFNLASILYQAFTGQRDGGLERQCRAVHQRQRRGRESG